MSAAANTTSAAVAEQYDSHQLAIDFDAPPPRAKFNGSDYVPERDDKRLRGQQLRIWELMRDHRWRTLAEIAAHTGDPEASVSAQLRHLRKPRFGGFTIDKQHVGRGLFHYRIAPPGGGDRS